MSSDCGVNVSIPDSVIFSPNDWYLVSKNCRLLEFFGVGLEYLSLICAEISENFIIIGFFWFCGTII